MTNNEIQKLLEEEQINEELICLFCDDEKSDTRIRQTNELGDVAICDDCEYELIKTK